MRRSRASALCGLAVLLALLLAWWLFRGEAPPAIEPPAEAAEIAPAPVEESPLPAPAPPPAEDPLATATVRVLDAKYGEPAKESLLEAEIVATPKGPELSVEDSGGGAWTLKGPRGAIVRVVASAAGFVPAERWLTLGRRAEVPVHLAPVAPCFLRVVAADGGQPVAGASIIVSGEPILFRGRNAARTWRGRTDAYGLVNCPEGGPGRRLRVSVLAPGFAFLSTDVEVPPAELLLPLEPATARRIRVTDDRGTPLPGARVLPAGLDGELLLPPEFAFEAGEDGVAEIPLPARSSSPAKTAVVVESTNRSPRFLFLPPAAGKAVESASLDNPWPGGITVVDSKGDPLSGIPVRMLPLAATGIPLRGLAADFEAVTDARGRVTIPAPMPGATYLASVGGAGELTLVSETFRSEDLRKFPEVKVPASTALSVRVVAMVGGPLGGAEVLLLPPGSWDDPPGAPDRALARAPAMRTDAGGVAAIRAPSAPSCVLASAGPFAWRVAEWDGTAPEVRLEVPPGPLLAIRVMNGDGGPIPGAKVRVRPSRTAALPPALRQRAVQEAITGPDGKVIFEVAPGCPLEVRADSRGTLDAAEIEAPPVGPAGGDLTLSLEEARTVWVVVEGPGKERIRNACVEVAFEALGARWLGRGSTGEQGVLAVPVPPRGSRGKDAHAVFSLLGTERAWGTLPIDGLVDGARVALSAGNQEIFLLRIEETPLWPRGTPVRWRSMPIDSSRNARVGTARVGEECALYVERTYLEGLIVQLPDSTPVVLPDEKGSERAREDYHHYAATEGRERKSKKEKQPSDNSWSNYKGRLQGPDAPWTFLPLREQDIFNETNGWARAKVVAKKGGAVGWTSRPLAPGQRTRCLVSTTEEWTVEWMPVRPTR